MKESPSERPTSSAPTPPLIIFVEPAPSILSMTFSGLSTSLTLVGRLRYLLLMFIIGVICLWPMKKFIDSRNEEQKPRAPAVKTEENRTAATPAHVTIGAAPGIARSASPPSSAPAAISNTAFGNSTEGEALKRRARLIFTEIVAMESIQYKEYGEFSDHLSTLLSDYQHQVPDHSEGLLNELHREGRVFLRVGAGKVQVAVRDWPYKGLWMMYTLLNDFRTRERMEESPTSSPPW